LTLANGGRMVASTTPVRPRGHPGENVKIGPIGARPGRRPAPCCTFDTSSDHRPPSHGERLPPTRTGPDPLSGPDIPGASHSLPRRSNVGPIGRFAGSSRTSHPLPPPANPTGCARGRPSLVRPGHATGFARNQRARGCDGRPSPATCARGSRGHRRVRSDVRPFRRERDLVRASNELAVSLWGTLPPDRPARPSDSQARSA
jgi:hypothetical protein